MTKQVKEGLGDLAAMAERDHEVQMARADLYKLAKYAIKLHDMLKSVSEAEGIEGWKQAKITTAADDISSVYHAMDYDMKFAESKSTSNVLKRSKTTNEVDYTSSLSERINKTLKKSLKQLAVNAAILVGKRQAKNTKRKKVVTAKHVGKAIVEAKAIAAIKSTNRTTTLAHIN